ncbi:MAG: metal ABC transporter permease [Treponema sp.]|jgi:zinc transport system permease protein|nr:metal ABC transporter permease [Treponema sp.]
MIQVLREIFSYPFLVRAAAAGFLVSLCAALLGVSLVLRRYSMIGDGLSHAGFGALAIASAAHAAPLAVAIPLVSLAAVFLLRLSETSKVRGDAAVALLSTGSLALGVMVVSVASGVNTDVNSYLFGSILAVRQSDVWLSAALGAAVLALFALCYHQIFAVTFDETFAKATGVKTGSYTMITAVLTALTIVLGMRMMGALLISSLIIFPALTSMRVCKSFKSVTICAVCVSSACFFSGLVISFLWATPAGASVVVVNMLFFAVFSAAGAIIDNR